MIVFICFLKLFVFYVFSTGKYYYFGIKKIPAKARISYFLPSIYPYKGA